MADSKTINDVLHDIQVALKVPKDEWNDFGKYRYRNAESILQKTKELLPEGYRVMCDTRVEFHEELAGRGKCICYATAALESAEGSISAQAYAIEPIEKKGMDAAQVSGATQSYAKKYALANLFAIDGEKDSDALTGKGEDKPSKPARKPAKGATVSEVEAAAKRAAEAGRMADREVEDAKQRLWQEVKDYCAELGSDPKAFIAQLFAHKPADEWTAEDFDSMAADLRDKRTQEALPL